MRVITGGCGFIGQMLGRDILRRGRLLAHARGGGEALAAVRELVLADVAPPARGPALPRAEAAPARVALGDVGDAAFCRSLFAGLRADEPVSLFHLGAVMSGDGERDFDLVMRVNLHGTLHLLEAARARRREARRAAARRDGRRPARRCAGAPTDFVKARRRRRRRRRWPRRTRATA